MQDLSIIIPAYKGRFLGETLDSLCQQTDKNFTLYIGDDCSPENLKEICDRYTEKIDLHYIRFDQNIGHHDLAAHWERCIDLGNEPYIWLFSDDDIMPNDAVERINTAIRTEGKELYRLPLLVVDEQQNILGGNPIFETPYQTAINSLMDKFSGRRPSAAIEYIFSRNLYLKEKKFEHFPVAWCSDDATWFKFALSAGQITNLPGAPVYWRQSIGYNISSSQNLSAKKMVATTMFLGWLYHAMTNHKTAITPAFLKALKQYIKTILCISLNKDFTRKELFRLSTRVAYFSPILAFKILFRYL